MSRVLRGGNVSNVVIRTVPADALLHLAVLRHQQAQDNHVMILYKYHTLLLELLKLSKHQNKTIWNRLWKKKLDITGSVEPATLLFYI